MKTKWKEYANYLEKQIEFNSQEELAEYILAIAKQSDKVEHHCDMEVSKAFKLKLRLTTHDKQNAITKKDWDLAEWIDNLD